MEGCIGLYARRKCFCRAFCHLSWHCAAAVIWREWVLFVVQCQRTSTLLILCGKLNIWWHVRLPWLLYYEYVISSFSFYAYMHLSWHKILTSCCRCCFGGGAADGGVVSLWQAVQRLLLYFGAAHSALVYRWVIFSFVTCVSTLLTIY